MNPRLVNFYRVVRDSPRELVEEAKKYPYVKETYYRARDRFNSGELSALEDAALLLYLNKTGYNGLYRVNSRGEFNVPFGTYKHPTVANEVEILEASVLLRRVDILCEDFAYIIKVARRGDLVYLDPPYEPLSKTSNFNTYSPSGFPWVEQERLASTVRELDTRAVLFVLSNNARARPLYEGFEVKTVRVPRSINTRADLRGPVEEIIVSNVPRRR